MRCIGVRRRSILAMPQRLAALLMLAMLGSARVCPAAAEPHELLKLVPADIGVCIELRDLQHELPRLHNSNVAVRFREMPIYQAWTASRPYEQFSRMASAIEKGAGQPLPDLAANLFGRYVILAVTQTPNRPPAGVLLTQVSSSEFLQKAILVWNALEGKEPVRREHAGQTYFAASRPARTKRPPETVYYFSRDDVLALSDNESAIQRVAALSRGMARNAAPAGEVEPSLFDDEPYRQAQAALAPRSLASIYLNPRAWDDTLGVERAGQSDELIPRLAARAWRSCRSLILGVRADEGAVVELIAQCDPETAGDAWKELTAQTAGEPGFLAKTPPSALGVTTGRGTFGEFATLVAALSRVQDPAGAQRGEQVASGLLLGRDLLADVLKPLRGNWGFYVQAAVTTAGEDDAAERMPLDAVAAWELPESSDGVERRGGPSLRKSLENALDFGLNLWAIDRNSKPGNPLAVIRSATHAGVQVRWLEGLGVVSPAYAFADRYLVVATSPAAVADFVKRDASDSLLQLADYQRWSAACFSQSSHVTFLNLAEVRRTLGEHRPQFVQQIAKLRGATVEQVAARLERLDPLLNLFDGAFAAATIEPSRVHIVFGAVATER